MPEPITVTLAGRKFGGWIGTRVAAGFDRACRDFSIEASERDVETGAVLQIRPGAACTVAIGGETVVTGYVDAVTVTHDARAHRVRIAGRSKTADLVDCAALLATQEALSGSVLSIARDLARPFGIEVIATVPTGAPPTGAFRVENGETAFAAIDRLCRLRGLAAHDDAQGRLVLDRTGSARSADAIRFGANVLAAEVASDASKVFSLYLVRGQAFGGADDFGNEAMTQAEGRARDARVTRYRPLAIKAEGGATIQELADRAAWEAASRAGKSMVARYTLAGWRQSDGTLWRPGLLVPVEDPKVALRAPLLIGEVEWRIDESGGELVTLRLSPPEAYVPQPEVLAAKVAQWADVQNGRKGGK